MSLAHGHALRSVLGPVLSQSVSMLVTNKSTFRICYLKTYCCVGYKTLTKTFFCHSEQFIQFAFRIHVAKTLRKKGFNGCDSPEPDGEDSIDQSPLNDDKYRKTTEDLDVLFKRYGVSHLTGR